MVAVAAHHPRLRGLLGTSTALHGRMLIALRSQYPAIVLDIDETSLSNWSRFYRWTSGRGNRTSIAGKALPLRLTVPLAGREGKAVCIAYLS
jgi:hypothetical protein